MITIVSGMRRCGTSMMMEALHEGGLPIMYNPTLEVHEPDESGYVPNPGGLYEVGFISYMNPKFLRMLKDGSCVKIMYDGLPILPKGDYKIIFMERDLEEMAASSQRVDDHIISRGRVSAINHPITATMPFCCYRTHNQDNIDHVLGICEMRQDIELVRVNYNDVVADPVSEFSKIKHRPSGKVRIDFDVEKAANIVSDKFYRTRHDDGKSGLRQPSAESSNTASG